MVVQVTQPPPPTVFCMLQVHQWEIFFAAGLSHFPPVDLLRDSAQDASSAEPDRPGRQRRSPGAEGSGLPGAAALSAGVASARPAAGPGPCRGFTRGSARTLSAWQNTHL